MGLDTTHDCWHGAYSAFSRWRDGLARAAGYELEKVTCQDGFTFTQAKAVNWGAITEDQLEGRWDMTPEDPLIVLFAHSDCGGAIYPAQAAPLADRLEELLPILDGLGDGGGHVGGYGNATRRFIAGLRAAVKAGETVEFR